MPRNLQKYKAYQKSYREANRQRLKQAAQDYYQVNKEAFNAYYQVNRETILAKRRQQRIDDPERAYAAKRKYREHKREHENALQQARRHANPEKTRAQSKASYDTNREKILDRAKQRRLENPEHIKEIDHRTVEKHRDARNARRRAGREADPEKAHAKDHAYREANRARVNANKSASEARRRARMLAAAINDLTTAERAQVIAEANGVCLYCPHYFPACELCANHAHILTIDHVHAVGNGGNNTRANIVACCRRCNSKKRLSPAPIPVEGKP